MERYVLALRLIGDIEAVLRGEGDRDNFVSAFSESGQKSLGVNCDASYRRPKSSHPEKNAHLPVALAVKSGIRKIESQRSANRRSAGTLCVIFAAISDNNLLVRAFRAGRGYRVPINTSLPPHVA